MPNVKTSNSVRDVVTEESFQLNWAIL